MVVVSGVPRPARVNLGAPLAHLVKQVLKDSGDDGRDENEFELRTEDGQQGQRASPVAVETFGPK